MVQITVDFVGMILLMTVGILLLIIFPFTWLPSAAVAYFLPSYTLQFSGCSNSNEQTSYQMNIDINGVCKVGTNFCLPFNDPTVWESIDAKNLLSGYKSDLTAGAAAWYSASEFIELGMVILFVYLIGFFAMLKPAWANQVSVIYHFLCPYFPSALLLH